MNESTPYRDRGPSTERIPHVGVGLWVQITHRFGPRMTEWMIAIITFLWGCVLLLPSETFDEGTFAIFRRIMGEDQWGFVFVMLGFLRIGGLVVNGARKNVTPWIRVISAALGFLIWVGICTAFALSGIISTWLAIYPVVAATELVNIYRAATDAGESHAATRNS